MNSKALLKSLKCLEALQNTDNPQRVKDIAGMTGLTLSSVQRSTYTLEALGYLSHDTDSSRFVPGPSCLRPAYGFLRNSALLEVTTPYLVDLSDRLDARCDLTVLHGTDIFYLARIPGQDELLNVSYLGRRWPAIHTASGRAILSALPPDQCEQILEKSKPRSITPKSTLDKESIRSEILEAQQLGYAKMLEEVLLGVASVAAPIIGKRGVLGALTIGGEIERFATASDRLKFGEMSKRTAQAISDFGL